MGATFGVSPGLIPKAIGYNLLGFAVGPLFWNPLSKTVGRRPVYLLGSFLFLPCAVWMALSPSYACFAAARTVAGLTSAWSQTIPPATIADIFPREVRGDRMSVFGTAVVIAPAVAPLFSGLIVNAHSWRNLFWFILGLAGLQFALLFALVPETLWIETGAIDTSAEDASSDMAAKAKADPNQHFEMAPAPRIPQGRVGHDYLPWHRPGDFFRVCASPILMLRYAVITLPSIYYGSLFAWLSVGPTVIWPQLAEAPPYDFATIPLGASFLAFGLGGVLGKWSGGLVGDKVVLRFERKKGYRQPEHRLWALLPILPFMLVALCIVGVAFDQSLHWIAVLVGGGLGFFCLSAATGILQTYVIETYLVRSMDVMAVFTFWKAIWGFVIPFFVSVWAEEDGYMASYAAQGALATGVGFLLTGGLIWKGYEIRQWQGMPVTPRE